MADLYDRLAADIVNGAQESWVSALTRLAAESLAKACENPDEFRLLSRVSPLGAMRLWAEWEGRVTSGVESAWREAMAEEDDEIVSTLTRRLGGRSYETGYAANVAASAARGMAEIMRRENIALAASAEREWYAATAEAVLRVEGGDSPRRAIEDAVSRLAKLGITTIDYKSGVSTSVDAALRRHLVTQANQARNDVLWRRMDEWGCDLVYTTAHYGARPTHAVWQGKVFSRSGRSAKYPPLVEATGYGTAAGLCGVNCRHRMVPYVEGATKLPDTDYSEQERLTGMTGGEYYAATQAQRRLEAAIRATKREVSVGEAAGADMTAGRVRLGELQSKLRAHCREHHLRRDYGRELAYGVPGAQPRALRLSVSENLGRHNARKYKVNTTVVGSKAYARRLRSVLGKCGDVAVDDARRMLAHRRGTTGEDLYAYDLTTGRRLDSVVSSKEEFGVKPSARMSKRIAAAISKGHEVATMHNHPGSSIPSAADLLSIKVTGCKFGVIVAHDGSIYVYEIVGEPAPRYNLDQDTLSFVYSRRSDDEAKAFEAIEQLLGARIVHRATGR
ncbi:phage minor capsid protein [Paratractidigestivibacter sp.]|uniref:phage minor capsid protein n=1 Tax=Paratractidigestivibacter sp. TaxID=2847316 RepID=UPI003A8D22BC